MGADLDNITKELHKKYKHVKDLWEDKHQEILNSNIYKKLSSVNQIAEDVSEWSFSNPNIISFAVGAGASIYIYYSQGADSITDATLGVINGVVFGAGYNLVMRVHNLYHELKRKYGEIDKSKFFKDPKTIALAGIFLGLIDGNIDNTVELGLLGYAGGLVLNDVESIINYAKGKTEKFQSMIKEKAKQGLEWMINYPVVSSIIANLTMASKVPVYGENLLEGLIETPAGGVMLPWYLGYVPFSIAKEYGLHKNSRFLFEAPGDSGIIKKSYYWMINNPKLMGPLFGVAAGAASAIAYHETTYDFALKLIFWSNLFGMTGEFMFNQIRYNKMIDTNKGDKKGLIKTIDKIFENPLYVGGFVTAAHLTLLINQDYETPEYLVTDIPVSLFFGASSAFITSLLGTFFHSQSSKKMWNNLYSNLYSTIGFHDKALSSFEKAMEVPTLSYQSARDNLHLSNLLLKAGKNHDRVIRLQNEAARILKYNELGVNHYDLLKSITGINKVSAKIAQIRHEIRPNREKDISFGLALIAEKKYDEGFGVLQEIFEENPDDPLINSVYGYSLISTGDREGGIEKFTNIAGNLSEIATIDDLRPFGGSKVYYIDHPAFGGLFALKEDKFDVLKNEMDVLLKFIDKILTSKHSKNFYRTTEPIAIINGGNEDFYITLRERGELLVDAGMRDINHVKRAASAQGFYHGTMSEELVKDDISIQEKRIVDRIRNHDEIDNKAKSLLIGNIDATIEDSVYLVFERDGHPYQYIIYKDKVIFIDTENRGYNQSTDDNSKLLFQADYIPREPQSLGLIESILLDNYAESFNNTAIDELKIRNGRDYVRRTLAAVPRKAFSYSSFSSGMPETEKARQVFLKNGVFAIDLIIDNFSGDYSIFDMKKFENLRKQLTMMIS
ncbi:hypothetical protein HQ529_04560 [Candidatus Woesearchaeota archaeon]|nr:hypothetical protein [Candidatus Woesearchaeota archaeon]